MTSKESAANQAGEVITEKVLNRCMELLISKGLWDIVNGTEPMPGPDHPDLLVSWKQKDSKALEIITDSATSPPLFKPDSSKAAWDYFNALHKKSKVKTSKDYIEYLPLHRNIVKGDWKNVEAFLKEKPHTVNARITPIGDTPLMLAVRQGHLRIVERLVSKLSKKDLELKNSIGVTPLYVAASRGGDVGIAKILLKKNKALVSIPNIFGMLPIAIAALFDNKDMVRYLYEEFHQNNTNLYEESQSYGSENFDFGSNASILLVALLTNDMYDVASRIFKHCPELAITSTPYMLEETALRTLAKKPSAFQSGSQMGLLSRCIYSCITVKSKTGRNAPSGMTKDVENPLDKDQMAYQDKGQLHAVITKLASKLLGKYAIALPLLPRWISQLILVVLTRISPLIITGTITAITGVNQIYEKKLMHREAHQLLKLFCDQVMKFDYSKKDVELHVHSSIFFAAQCGNAEFILEIINSCPSLIWIQDEYQQTIFHVAVKHRQENVFNLIHKLRFEKKSMAYTIDAQKNTILHLAGLLSPPERLHTISGAALQMQRELQWFKEVKTLIPPSYWNARNQNEQTPQAIFTDNHKDLVKQGEKWMKTTASSCTVVATLIATVMFAAAFQVPGGIDNNGLPHFLHANSFVLFAITDAISLFSSITSALMFLYILTSRYGENDFLTQLPKRLIIGLFFLFVSMVTMIVSYGAAIFIMLHHQVKWITVPIILLAVVPITLFVLMQFPLFLDMINFTYGSTIFIKDTKPFCY